MINIASDYSFLLTGFCILIGLIYSLILYWRSHISNKYFLITLFVFRSIVVSLICILLLDPIITSRFEKLEKPIIVIAQDISSSCNGFSDSLTLSKLCEDLSANFDVFPMKFSSEVSEEFSMSKTGFLTNYTNLLDEIEIKFSGKNLSGIILSSDGIYNKGGNPLYHKLVNKIPIYTLPLGDTIAKKDLRVKDVIYNKFSYLNNKSPVIIKIQADQFKGEKIRLSLYKNDKIVFSQERKVSFESEIINFETSVLSNQSGLIKYMVVVDCLEEEEYRENNEFEFVIDVLDNKKKILLISERVHPDIGAIKSVLEYYGNYSYDIYSLDQIDTVTKKYDLAILFYLKENQLPQNIVRDSLGCSILFFANIESISSISSLYPNGSILDVTKVSGRTVEFNNRFSKFNISENLRNYLEKLDPIYALNGRYRQSVTSDVLLYDAESNNKNPFIILDNILNRKIGIIYGEGIWRWRINDRSINMHANFNELFSKIFNYLLIQHNKSRVNVVYDRKMNYGEDFIIRCENYNQNYELNNDQELFFKLIDESNNELDFKMKKINSKYSLKLDKLINGKYSFNLSFKDKPSLYNGEFIVLNENIEDIYRLPDHNLLYKLSNKSGGWFFNKQDVSQLSNKMIRSDMHKSIIYSQFDYKKFLDNIFILTLLISLLLLEWITRKYFGSY